MQLAFWNGAFLPLHDVRISPMDRGYLFGDGVYEVLVAYRGALFEEEAHYRRLHRSMEAIGLKGGPSLEELSRMAARLVRECPNYLDGRVSLYIQVTRGTPSTRAHVFPKDVSPNVFALASFLPDLDQDPSQLGIRAITAPDQRWACCHIKAISLLGAVLASEDAVQQKASECILIRDGCVTEGAISNVFIVKEGVIMTPVADHRILDGITRQTVMRLAHEKMIPLQERDVDAAALGSAEEIWVTSTTKEIRPVVMLDHAPVGSGIPGPFFHEIRAAFDSLTKETL